MFRSSPDFVMRDRKSCTGGKYSPPSTSSGAVERIIDGSEYADDCAMLYLSRAQLVKYIPLLVTLVYGGTRDRKG